MSSVETLSALERRLNATIPQQQVSADVEIRLKRVGRTAKVAGFRPGKVPYKIVEQQYGPQVREEVVGDHLQRAFAEAAEANGLKVVGVPRFEVKTDLKADPIEFSATFEVYPEITLGDLSGKDVERVAFELSEADVENTIETLRKKRATYEKVDRAAQNEDKVVIDFNGVLNGEPFEGGQGKDFPVVLGGGRMLPDFENAIVGMKAGETKSFDMTFPENYHGKDVAGKQVTFTITAHSVEGPKLPELDAEFAKSLGVTDGDVEKLKATGATKIVSACPECVTTLKVYYPEFVGALPFQVFHLTEVLDKYVASGELKLRKDSKEVTFQDPCRLGRFLNVYDQPRNLLKAICGDSFKDMRRSRNASICCGTSGWMNCGIHSKAIQTGRLTEARKTGSRVLATACAKCKIHFTCAMNDTGFPEESKIEVEDLAVLLASSLVK